VKALPPEQVAQHWGLAAWRQVRRTIGVSEAPDSSKNTMQACRLRALCRF